MTLPVNRASATSTTKLAAPTKNKTFAIPAAAFDTPEKPTMSELRTPSSPPGGQA